MSAAQRRLAKKALEAVERRFAAARSEQVSSSLEDLARMLDDAVAGAKNRIGKLEPGDRRTLVEADAELQQAIAKVEFLAI